MGPCIYAYLCKVNDLTVLSVSRLIMIDVATVDEGAAVCVITFVRVERSTGRWSHMTGFDWILG
jgi:hypothetical protein